VDSILVGRRIQQYRKARGMRQEALAECAELSPNHMSAIERGTKIPRLETFIRIANALNVPSDLLLVDVLKTTNEIKASDLAEKLSHLESDEQQRIINVIEVMINDAKK